MNGPSNALLGMISKGYDPAQRESELLSLQNQRNALSQQPEERNWLREQRWMEKEQFRWQRQQEIERIANKPFKNQDEAMAWFKGILDYITPENWDELRTVAIRRVEVSGGNSAALKSMVPEKFPGNDWIIKMKGKAAEKPTLVPKGTIGTMGAGGEIKPLPPGLRETEEIQSKTPEQLTAGELREELGREPTNKEIKERIKKEAKGYGTAEEAFVEAQRMHSKAGDKAGLIPSYELSPQNKYIPKLLPNIEVRIPPFVQGQNLPPGIIFNRKSGKYSDTTTGKNFDREELINLYGVNAAINADKMALGELTKREQLIKVFTNRIDANIPIVLDAVKEVENKNPRLLNEAMNRGRQFLMGSGKWQALQTAMLSLSNEVQRLESNSLGIGGQGQEERKVWAKIHDPNMTFKDIKILANMIQKLSKTATTVIEKQRNDLIKRIPTEGSGNEPNTPEGTKTKVRTGTVQSGPNQGKKVTEWSDGSKTYE